MEVWLLQNLHVTKGFQCLEKIVCIVEVMVFGMQKSQFVVIYSAIYLNCSICLIVPFFIVWATTWQNQQNECVPSEDSDQPGHPVWSVFAVRSVGS